MLAYPLVVAAVSLVFAILVYRQYAERRRPHQLIWTISLAQSCIASVAYLLSLAMGGNALMFKIYYIFGALLVAAWLGLGSIYLMAPGRMARLCAWVVVALSVIGAVQILAAPVDVTQLRSLAGGSGRGVLQGRSWLPVLVFMNTFGTVGVVVPALLSAWRLARRQAAPRFVAGNALIAVGVLVLAFAGTAARLGAGGFWLTMALGWIVTFAGFVIVSGRGLPAAGSKAKQT